ncbi:MAG: DUF58 domain-containing protein [Gammaproteobacteria bacterium]|nr:DUF58 domain-containing protein [Gammaproteobacteria bacterium]
MTDDAIIEEPELQRFARLAAPYLQRAATGGHDPRAARDRPGSGLEFLDLRDYQVGDDMRHIDWRQTARRQRPVVRRFRSEAAVDWFICVDGSASVGLHPAKWAMSIRLASALAYTCLFAGHRVALLIFSDRIKARCDLGRGAHQYPRLLNLLLAQQADAPPTAGNGRTSLMTPSHLKTLPVNRSNPGLCRDYLSGNSNVFIISDFLQPDGMRSQLRSIQSIVSSTAILQVLAEDEVDIAATGLTQLRDVESGRERQVNLSDQIKSDARTALRTHRNDLHKDCLSLGIRMTSCESGQHWQPALLEHLRIRL